MEQLAQALGIVTIFLDIAAAYLWATLRTKISSKLWWTVVALYAVVVTYNIFDFALWDGVQLIKQAAETCGSALALLVIVKTKDLVTESHAFVHGLDSLLSEPKDRAVSAEIVGHIAVLKDQLRVVEKFARTVTESEHRPLALSLAEYFASRTDELEKAKADAEVSNRLISESPIPIVVTDHDGRLTYANSAYLSMLGCEIDDALGAGWSDFVELSRREATIRHWNGEVALKKPMITGSVDYVTEGEPLRCAYRMMRMKTGYMGYILPADSRFTKNWGL